MCLVSFLIHTSSYLPSTKNARGFLTLQYANRCPGTGRRSLFVSLEHDHDMSWEGMGKDELLFARLWPTTATQQN